VPPVSADSPLPARLERLRTHRLSLGAVAAAVAALGTAGCLLQIPWLLAVLLSLAIYPLLLADLAAADRRRATLRLLVWGLSVVALGALFTAAAPERAARAMPAGDFLHWESIRYLTRGFGLLDRPSDFATDHVLDYVYVTLGSAFGGGLVALWIGAGPLLAAGHHWVRLGADSGAAAAWLLGLRPWDTVGAVGHALLIVAWGEVTGAVVARRAIQWRTLGLGVAAATLLLGIAFLLKLALADPWRAALAPVLGQV